MKTGRQFRFGGNNWAKLDEKTGRNLCISSEGIGCMPFDLNFSDSYEKSSLSRWLNSDYLEMLIRQGATATGFLPFTIDVSRNGTGQWVHELKVHLLSYWQWWKYARIIPILYSWWWTSTPIDLGIRGPGMMCVAGRFGATYAYYPSTNPNDVQVRPVICLADDCEVQAVEAGITKKTEEEVHE